MIKIRIVTDQKVQYLFLKTSGNWSTGLKKIDENLA
jgi:hypothetical protein